MPGKTHQHRQQCWLQVEKQTPFWIKDLRADVALGFDSFLENFGAGSYTFRLLELAPISKFLPFAPIQRKSVDATDQYTDLLWEGVQKRLPYTDLSNSPCAFSEAPAEGIFSIFSRVCRGRESLTIAHATALTRIAAHGPPAATKDAAEIAKKALKNYKSQC